MWKYSDYASLSCQWMPDFCFHAHIFQFHSIREHLLSEAQTLTKNYGDNPIQMLDFHCRNLSDNTNFISLLVWSVMLFYGFCIDPFLLITLLTMFICFFGSCRLLECCFCWNSLVQPFFIWKEIKTKRKEIALNCFH